MASNVTIYEPGGRGRQATNPDLKIARANAHAQEYQATLEFAGKMLNNPIVELAAWMLVFDYFENHLPGHGVMKLIEEIGSPAVFAAGVGTITAQALAPTMPMLAQGLGAIGGLAKTIGLASGG